MRSEDKAKNIAGAFPDGQVQVVIVPDIAAEGAFDEVAKTAGLEYVLHSMCQEREEPSKLFVADSKTQGTLSN